jgi:hypothetical protein
MTCDECGCDLHVGQPMYLSGRYHAHVGCAVIADIRTQYGAESLRSRETLPPLAPAPRIEAA